jgi:NinB protein
MRLSALITLRNRADLIRAVANAPVGAQFDLVDDPRTLAQNRLMWAQLTDVSDQLTHGGEKWEPEDWKCCFMKALGFKLRFMPSLDGDGVVALGYRSSKLDKEKFSELIELIYSEGVKRGVVFHGEAA